MYYVTVDKGMVEYEIDADNEEEALSSADEMYNDRDFDIRVIREDADNGNRVVSLSDLRTMLYHLQSVANEITMDTDYFKEYEEAQNLIGDIAELSNKIGNYLSPDIKVA